MIGPASTNADPAVIPSRFLIFVGLPGWRCNILITISQTTWFLRKHGNLSSWAVVGLTYASSDTSGIDMLVDPICNNCLLVSNLHAKRRASHDWVPIVVLGLSEIHPHHVLPFVLVYNKTMVLVFHKICVLSYFGEMAAHNLHVWNRNHIIL